MAKKTVEWPASYVKLYAEDENKFFEDFGAAFSKLQELGVQFPDAVEARHLKRRE
ncbi:MAG: hypothetical protein SGCHY_001897 [Lobulomycetales sp.]